MNQGAPRADGGAQMGSMSPGWYDDGHGSMRWWDGAQWTEHVAEPEHQSEEAGEQQPADAIPVYRGVGDTVAFPAPWEGEYPAPPTATATGAGQGAFVGPDEPRKSRAWIVWLVAGVALLGVLIALAIVVPMAFLGLTADAGSTGVPTGQAPGGTSPEPAAEGPADSEADESAEPPSAADQQAAADAVQRHNQAWLVGDCESYLATTTEQFREIMQATDCESFAIQSRNLAGVVDDYTTTIGDVETIGDAVSVSTTESYSSMYDNDGNPTDERLNYEDRYEYVVVSSNDIWVIDDFFLE